MLPYLATEIVGLGLPTVYFAARYREYRRLLAGAFSLAAACNSAPTSRKSPFHSPLAVFSGECDGHGYGRRARNTERGDYEYFSDCHFRYRYQLGGSSRR